MPADDAWTIRRLLGWTADFLRKKGNESPRLEAEILLAHALGCPRIELYTRSDEEPPEPTRTAFKALLKRRLDGEPVAHLVGKREFYALPFKVTPDVLVPRPETELLVMKCLEHVKPAADPRVLDVGTGSGCVAVAVAKNHKTARVTAADASPAALAVARENAAANGVAERVRFLEGDLFAAVPAGETFDAVASNPPYIATAEIATLQPEVRDREPRPPWTAGRTGWRSTAASPRTRRGSSPPAACCCSKSARPRPTPSPKS